MQIVHVPKIVERKVPVEKLVPIEVPKPFPYPVEKKVRCRGCNNKVITFFKNNAN